MRFLHSADWHVGRVFYGVSLIDDQRLIFDQLVDVIERTQPDAVLIAGDLYDRAVPPPEAVSLLDDVLSRIVLGARVPVFAIAGNHDSPDRTEFLGRLLSEGNLHLQGRLRPGDAAPTLLMDEHGPVAVHLIPFAEPSHVDELLVSEASADKTPVNAARPVGKLRRHHGDAMRALLSRAKDAQPAGARQVVVAHGSVVGGQTSESERPLFGGASAFVDVSDFAGFDYAALGHFHRPQNVGGAPRVRYAGSPLAYSFSEEGHEKSVTVVDLDANGDVHQEIIPLVPRRALRSVEGTFRELMQSPRSDDFIRAVLTDDTPILDPAGRLRARWPQLVSVENLRLRATTPRTLRDVSAKKIDDTALLLAFLNEVGEEPSDAEREALVRVLATRGGTPA